MNFFNDLEENFEKAMADHDRIQREQKQAELNMAIKNALEQLDSEAKVSQIEFSFTPQPPGQTDTWITDYKGKMIVLFTSEIANKLSDSPELDVSGAVKNLLIDKVHLAI